MKRVDSQVVTPGRYTPYGRDFVRLGKSGAIEFNGITYTLVPGAEFLKISRGLVDGFGRPLAERLDRTYGKKNQLPTSVEFDEVFADCAIYSGNDQRTCKSLIKLAPDLQFQSVERAASVYATALAMENTVESKKALRELRYHALPGVYPRAVLAGLNHLNEEEAWQALHTLPALRGSIIPRNFPGAMLAGADLLDEEGLMSATWWLGEQLLLAALVHDDAAVAKGALDPKAALDVLTRHIDPSHLYHVMFVGFRRLPVPQQKLVLARFGASHLYAAAFMLRTYNDTLDALDVLEKHTPSDVLQNVLDGFELLSTEAKANFQRTKGSRLLASSLASADVMQMEPAVAVLAQGMSPRMQYRFILQAYEFLCGFDDLRDNAVNVLAVFAARLIAAAFERAAEGDMGEAIGIVAQRMSRERFIEAASEGFVLLSAYFVPHHARQL